MAWLWHSQPETDYSITTKWIDAESQGREGKMVFCCMTFEVAGRAELAAPQDETRPDWFALKLYYRHMVELVVTVL